MNFTFKGPCILKYMPIVVHQDVTIYSLFISVYRCTCFGWYLHPSSGAHVTVSTAPGISKTVTATCRERDWTGTDQFPSNHVTRQSSTQINKCQVSHKYSCFSWWWANSRPNRVETRNKHAKKNCAPSWLYLQDQVWTYIVLGGGVKYFYAGTKIKM